VIIFGLVFETKWDYNFFFHLKAIEVFLAGKTYLMGAKVCNEDATLFGHLVQAVYHDRGPLHEYVIGI
jgi:hypothetical protein